MCLAFSTCVPKIFRGRNFRYLAFDCKNHKNFLLHSTCSYTCTWVEPQSVTSEIEKHLLSFSLKGSLYTEIESG